MAKFDRSASHDETSDECHHGDVQTLQQHGVGVGERPEERTAENDEPGFVGVPDMPDRLGHEVAFVLFPVKETQNADTQVKTVGDDIEDEHKTEQAKPCIGQQAMGKGGIHFEYLGL